MRSRHAGRLFVAIVCALLASGIASAQRGTPPPAIPQATTPEPLKFRYMGPAPAGPHRVRGRRSRRSQHLLPGLGVRRRVEIHRRRQRPSSRSSTTSPSPRSAAIAVADSDPNIVWVGTGEPWVIRYSDVMGDGVYKSTDAGKTWKHMGLTETGRISRVLIHPTEPEHRLRLRRGPPDRPAGRARRVQDRPTAAPTGSASCSSIATRAARACDGPSDPNTLLAGTWQVEQHTWAQLSGGPGSGVYVTHDGGAKWTKADDRPAEVAGRQDRRRDRAVEHEAHVRADSDRRPGIALAIGRRRRDVEGRELGSLAHRPRRLLHPHGGQPAESGRRLHFEQQLPPLAGRRQDVQRQRRRPIRLHAGTGELRRLPRHLDRSEGSGPLRR